MIVGYDVQKVNERQDFAKKVFYKYVYVYLKTEAFFINDIVVFCLKYKIIWVQSFCILLG